MFDYELKSRQYGVLRDVRRSLEKEKQKITNELDEINREIGKIEYEWGQQLQKMVSEK